MSFKNTKAIILAAGCGKRMKSELPKVLHKIFDVELLKYVYNAINSLVDLSYIIVGHQATLVENYCNNNLKNIKCLLQSPQRGTGDAVKKAYNELEDFEGNVIILCGDAPLIQESTIKEFIEYHNQNQSTVTVMTTEVANPKGYGRIIRDEHNKLLKIVEEKDANSIQKEIKEVNGGVYCLDWQKIKQAFNELDCNNAQNEYYLTDIIEILSTTKKVNAFLANNDFKLTGINDLYALAEVEKKYQQVINENHMLNGVHLINPDSILIEDTVVIEPSVTIDACSIIRGNTKIKSGTYIEPFSLIVDGKKIK